MRVTRRWALRFSRRASLTWEDRTSTSEDKTWLGEDRNSARSLGFVGPSDGFLGMRFLARQAGAFSPVSDIIRR